MNGTQWPDWWRGLGVRRSASSDKTADCFSSTDYSNLDVQKGPAAADLSVEGMRFRAPPPFAFLK